MLTQGKYLKKSVNGRFTYSTKSDDSVTRGTQATSKIGNKKGSPQKTLFVITFCSL